MGKLVMPKVFRTGYTIIDREGMTAYLQYTNNLEFLEAIHEAIDNGVSEGEILCSFYAKLCYKSLTLGKNKNVSKVRDIQDNVKGCVAQAHSSVFRHCKINFVVTDCSRVFTHEMVRHGIGTAFSQTSGRYVRGETLDLVFDPILEPVREEMETLVYLLEQRYKIMVEKIGLNDPSLGFDFKKKATSALRRILPNGQSNEIGFSVNLNAIRHQIMMRTARHAEWEARLIYNQIYDIMKAKYPLMFCDARERMIDGQREVYGMKMQPYDRGWEDYTE